jgi:hypothetical protein
MGNRETGRGEGRLPVTGWPIIWGLLLGDFSVTGGCAGCECWWRITPWIRNCGLGWVTVWVSEMPPTVCDFCRSKWLWWGWVCCRVEIGQWCSDYCTYLSNRGMSERGPSLSIFDNGPRTNMAYHIRSLSLSLLISWIVHTTIWSLSKLTL